MKIGEIVGPNFVYPTESTILRVGLRTQKADDAFLTARRQTRQWIESVCARSGLAIEPGGGDVVRSNDRGSIDLAIRPARLVAALCHDDERFPERTWHVNVDLSSEEGGDVAILNLRLGAEHPSNARPVEPYPSRLVGLLCTDPGLYDFEPLKSSAIVVRPADVAGLAGLINATERRLPVILASRPPPLDMHRLAHEVAGLAHVFDLDEETSWELSRRYGRPHSAYLGAVKIYPAGVTLESDPKNAPLFLQQTPAMLERDRKAESTVRRSILADLTAQFETEPLLTPKALRAQEKADVEQRAAQAEKERREPAPLAAASMSDEELQRARQEAAAARQEAEGYWREILELSARAEQLEGELAQLRRTELGVSVEELTPGNRELLRTIFGAVNAVRDVLLDNDRLHGQLDDLRSEYEALRTRLAPLYDDHEAPVAMLAPIARPAWDDFDALQVWAHAQYGGALAFHPRVRDRLQDGNPQDLNALFDILDILGTDYVAMKRGLAGARERYVERVKRYKSEGAHRCRRRARRRDLRVCTRRRRLWRRRPLSRSRARPQLHGAHRVRLLRLRRRERPRARHIDAAPPRHRQQPNIGQFRRRRTQRLRRWPRSAASGPLVGRNEFKPPMD